MKVFAWDPNAAGGSGAWEPQPRVQRKFVWCDWFLLPEYDGMAGNASTERLLNDMRAAAFGR